ncbi:MAG: hypothetical protein ACE5IT_06495 [bacterium]
MARVLTTCIYCGCGCGLYLESENAVVRGSYPSGNHPVSKGALCVKGWNAYEFINKPDRLKAPLIKANPVRKLTPSRKDFQSDERGNFPYGAKWWSRRKKFEKI